MNTRICIITEDEAASSINVLAYDNVLVLHKDGTFRALGEVETDTHQRIKDDVDLTVSAAVIEQQSGAFVGA